MGCGNSRSKLNPEGELVPPRIRPLLRSKIKKHKNGINLKDGALSKKVFLNDRVLEVEENSYMLVVDDDDEDDDNNNNNNNITNRKTKTMSSSPIDNDSPKNDDSPIPHLDTPLDQFKPDKTMDEHTSLDQEGDDNEDNRCFICPGSPSFRVYFVEETENDRENVEMKDTGIDVEDISHKKSPSHDSVESSSAKLGEGQENKMIKKGKKERVLIGSSVRKDQL